MRAFGLSTWHNFWTTASFDKSSRNLTKAIASQTVELLGKSGAGYGAMHAETKWRKTNMMIFILKHHLWMYGGCSLTTVDDTILPSDRIMNLGIHIDQHLTMTGHVTAVCAPCNYHLHRSPINNTALTNNWSREKCGQRTRHLSPRLLQLTQDCITYLYYGWLQRVQNNAARLITRSSKHDPTSHQCWRSCIGCRLIAESS